MTITERVQTIQNEISKGNLQPERAAEMLTELAALSGNINEEITGRQVAYNKVLLSCLESEKSANRAKIRAEISDEYIAKKKVENIKDLNTELIRSLKYFLKAKEEEKQHSRHF